MSAAPDAPEPELASAPDGWRKPLTAEDILWVGLVALLGAVAYVGSYGRLLDSLIDSGRDLYIPEQIRAGKRLYADFQYYYPPVAPYALALLTLVLGSSLGAYAWIGLLVSVLAATLLYALGRGLSGRRAGATAALLFAGCNFTAAGHLGSNFVFPYSHAATIGMLLVLTTAYFLARHLFAGGGEIDLRIALAAGLLAAWSKIELALLVGGLWLGAGLWYRLPLRRIAAFFVLAAASLAVAAVYFHDPRPGRHWLSDNILPATHLRGEVVDRFYARVSGVAEWRTSLATSAAGAALLAALAAAIAALERVLRLPSRPTSRRALLAVPLVAAWAWAGDAVAGRLFTPGEPFFRAWTLIQAALLVALAASVLGLLRTPALARDEIRRSPLPFLLLLALLASVRIWLALTPSWYGFSLLLPVYPLIGYVLFRLLPDLGLYSRRAAWLWMPIVLLVAVKSLAFQRLAWGTRHHRVDSPRGVFHEGIPGRAEAMRAFLAWAARARPRTLVVIPESPTLNYFTRSVNPTYFHMFTPVVSDHPEMEAQMIEDFERTRPQYVAYVQREVAEFGYRGFGADYNLRLAAYLSANYREIEAWSRPDFFLRVLERRE